MANANTKISIDGLHTAIVEAIRAQMPALQTVEAYSLDRQNLATPACLIEMTEMEVVSDAPDPGTGQLAVRALFSARFVIGFRQGGANPKMEARKLGAAFAVFARLNRWGLPIAPASVLGIYPDDFDPELDQFECARVDWWHIIHLSESVWDDPAGVTPTPVFSFAPDIGLGNESHYKPLGELLSGEAGE